MSKLSRRAESAFDFLCAMVIAVLLACAVLHFFEPCTKGMLC
jgi:hypothetical protein